MFQMFNNIIIARKGGAAASLCPPPSSSCGAKYKNARYIKKYTYCNSIAPTIDSALKTCKSIRIYIAKKQKPIEL